MKKTSRILALILAGLMLSSCFVACKDDENNDPTPGDTTAAESTTAGGEGEVDPVQSGIDTLKELVNWNGKAFTILYASDLGGYGEEVEIVQDNASVINEAVHRRNNLFEEYAKLDFRTAPAGQGDIVTKLQGEVQTGTGDYQFISNQMSNAASNASSGYLYNYMNMNIDYEQDWWDSGTLDFVLDGNVFFMNGSFNIVDDDVTMLMIFNKRLRSQYGVEDLYATAKSGKWTLDKFNGIITGLSSENGDGKWDEKDTYGFSCPSTIGNTFFYGAGLQFIANTREMDEPELVLTGTKQTQALDVLDLTRTILHSNNSSYVAAPGNEGLAMTVFTSGRSLFYVEAASYLRTLQASMEDEYGIIPIPKFLADQASYSTWSHSIGSTLSFPTSVAKKGNDMDNFAGIVELYALLSEQLVRPAYYKQMLTTRNVHDVESSEMVDLIFLHRTYDMAQVFQNEFGMSELFSNEARKTGAHNFASAYRTKAISFPTAVNKLMKKMREAQKSA